MLREMRFSGNYFPVPGVADAVHIALHRAADGIAVQIAVVAGPDAVGSPSVATISGALVPVSGFHNLARRPFKPGAFGPT